MRRHDVALLDPFELPDWLGVEDVTYTAVTSLGSAHLVTGTLRGAGGELGCDVLACDLAYPLPVLDEAWRHDAHQAWTLGEVLLVEYDGRLTLAVPGTEFTADGVLEAVGRLAKAVGAPPDRFVVSLRL